jgi:branched-chain amino acid transport system substrate-binding protein
MPMSQNVLIGVFVVILVIVGAVAYYAGKGAATTVTTTITQEKTVTATQTQFVTVTGTPGPTTSPSPTTTPSPTTITQTVVVTTPVEFKGEVKVGALLPLNLPIGQLMLGAIQMAADEINAKGGVLGYKVIVVPYDTQWQADKAAEGYKYLAQQGVKVVLGVFGSHEALAIMDLLALYQVPVIASGAVSDQLDQMVLENYDLYKYWFRAYVSATMQAAATWDILAYISKTFNYTRYGWIYEDLPWVIPHAAYGQVRSQQEGMILAAAVGVKTDITSFADAFQKVLSNGSQIIVWQFSGTEDYVFARDYYDMQVPLIALGGGSYAMLDQFYNQTGGKAEGLICISWGFPAPFTPKTMEFYNKFKQTFKTEPIFTTWYAYDSLYIWANAVESAGTFDVEKVIPILEKTVYVGVAGIYEFTQSHSAKLAPDRIYPVFFQWQSGQRVVVWPLNVVAPGTKLLVPKLEGGKRVWVEVPWPPK